VKYFAEKSFNLPTARTDPWSKVDVCRH